MKGVKGGNLNFPAVWLIFDVQFHFLYLKTMLKELSMRQNALCVGLSDIPIHFCSLFVFSVR